MDPLEKKLTEIAAELQIGTLRAVGLTQLTLDAIENTRSLNAFVSVHTESALAEAHDSELRQRAGRPRGLLDGIGIAIKDNIDIAAVPCRAGCKAYQDRVPEEDAQVVSHLKQAGAVILGQTNMDELADGVTSLNPHFGPVHNPWRPGYHPGGSSGGSAVAVAAGCASIALGTDTGGSVRIPAALCGVVGFKPSAGRIPTKGLLPLSKTLDEVGVIGRCVDDVCIVFRTLEGQTPCIEQDPQKGFQAPVVGVPKGFGQQIDEEVMHLFTSRLSLVEDLSKDFGTVRIDRLAQSMSLLSTIYAHEAAAYHAQRLRDRPAEFGELVRRDLVRGGQISQPQYEQALHQRSEFTQEIEQLCHDLDVLVTPTTAHPARSIGSPKSHTYLALTCPFNLTGQPAITIPIGFVNGLPIGMQLIGKRGEDDSLLAFAAVVERSISEQLKQNQD